jgi:death on curing protein
LARGKKHYRLTADDIFDAHDAALQYGGQPGVINENSILSAIARPYAEYGGRKLFRTMPEKAAALVDAVAGWNHGFTDGNKRTAFICVNILLDNSGYNFATQVSDTDVEELMVRVATHNIVFSELVRWFRDRIARRARRE